MKLIVLNHKMNLFYKDLDKYINEINNINKNLIIAPSNIFLLEFIKRTNHKVASQDVCYIDGGNYTGKVSWSQIKSIGIKYSLIGHSEKGDNLEKINSKVKACLSNGITPILCFGNTENESVIDVLNKINIFNKNVIYAYEPINNIGGSKVDINFIENNINKIYFYLNKKGIKKPTILYGGGIKKHNIKKIYKMDLLAGILIGSISSDINQIKNLLKEIDEK